MPAAQEERPDKCSSFNGRDGNYTYNLSPPVEQNGNDDGGDHAVSKRNNDDVDENDPFSKRRYYINYTNVSGCDTHIPDAFL